jgi:spore germination cell wall hydrolase CwlJ-like protein
MSFEISIHHHFYAAASKQQNQLEAVEQSGKSDSPQNKSLRHYRISIEVKQQASTVTPLIFISSQLGASPCQMNWEFDMQML